MEKFNCLKCNIEFMRYKCHIKKSGLTFCSQVCKGKYFVNIMGKLPPSQKGKNMGENNWRWISDRTKIKVQEERNNPNDKQWKYGVYKRDNFKCKIADKNCSGRIEAHHILGWTAYPELRYQPNNGITLCHAHHPRKRVDEAKLSPFFQQMVAEVN